MLTYTKLAFKKPAGEFPARQIQTGSRISDFFLYRIFTALAFENISENVQRLNHIIFFFTDHEVHYRSKKKLPKCYQILDLPLKSFTYQAFL